MGIYLQTYRYRNEMRFARKGGMPYSEIDFIRYFFPWYSSVESNSNTMNAAMPWVTFKAISFLKKNLLSSHKVFEYGGGGSTLFFAKRCKEVVTAEHHTEWFRHIESEFEKMKVKNWKGFLQPAQAGDFVSSPDISNPQHYSSSDPNYKHHHFHDYVHLIDQFPQHHFDLILVDGRSRPSCAFHSFEKLKPGGWLIHDNLENVHYRSMNDQFFSEHFDIVSDGMCAVPFSLNFSRTVIFRKK